MATNFNIVLYGPKLDGKLDYSYREILMSTHLKAHNIILKLSYKWVEKTQKLKLQSLRRGYERYQMSSSGTVEQYFLRVTNFVNNMRVYGEDIPESKGLEKILRTMLMKFDHVVT